MEAQAFTIDQPFPGAYEKCIEITSHLSAKAQSDQTHSDIEASLETDGRDLLRLRLQEHVDQQGPGRVGEAVRGSDGVVRSHQRDHMGTGYQSVLGAVRVARTGYSQRGVSSVFPRDAQLHLPRQSYAHRWQKRVAAKAAKMAFESVADDIAVATGVRIGTRQIEEIVYAAAQDFDAFYAQPCPEDLAPHAAAQPIQVLTFAGKGVVMRPEALREATRKRAEGKRRDPAYQAAWVVLVDGDLTQLDDIEQAARSLGVEVVSILDIIHVLEYLWKAAKAWLPPDDPTIAQWVSEQTSQLL